MVHSRACSISERERESNREGERKRQRKKEKKNERERERDEAWPLRAENEAAEELLGSTTCLCCSAVFGDMREKWGNKKLSLFFVWEGGCPGP